MPKFTREFEKEVIAAIQACRIANYTWPEANEWLKKQGIEISEDKFYDVKHWLEETVDARIQNIAKDEYAEMHIKLIDNTKEMLERLKQFADRCFDTNDTKGLVKIYEETRHVTELLNDLYNASVIVGRTRKLVEDVLKQVEELKKKVEPKMV
jgi:phosphoglycolate phosphatase-like HAD superfamily hydrolase